MAGDGEQGAGPSGAVMLGSHVPLRMGTVEDMK